MKPKAYSYIRFSTPEQRKGDSLRRQTEYSEQYVKQHGLILDDRLKMQDLGVSAYCGANRDKGALGAFLKLVETGDIVPGSVLLVESLDRLSREEITEALAQFLSIIGKGIKVVTLADNREYTKETINANFGELMYSLTIMARAHEESATKSMRSRKTWEEKRKNVRIRNLTKKCPAWLKPSDYEKNFIPIPDREKVICSIFDMKLAGKGATTIVRELNSKPDFWKPKSRDKRKDGEGWRESYVKKILQNRAVIGEFQLYRKVKGKREPIGEAILDYYPKVIDRDVFFRVQEQIKSNIHKGGKTGKVNNLFTHIAKCGYCGGPMAFIDKGPAPKGGKYLVCDRARRGLGCCNVTIRYDEFERLALSHCKGLQPKDILNENDDRKTAITLLKDQRDGKVGELNSTISEIENLAHSMSKTSDERVSTLLEKTMTEKFDMRDSLESEVNNLNQQIETSSQSFEDTQLTLDSLNELITYLSTAETKKLVEVRLKLRNEIKKLISVINVYPAGHNHYTIETAKKALDDISMVISKEENPNGYAQIKENYRRRVESPKDFRFFIINFKSGSARTINPERKIPLAIDFDKEERIVRTWNEGPDERIIYEEFSDDGIKTSHFRSSMASNNKEILQEIFDDEWEKDNRFTQ